MPRSQILIITDNEAIRDRLDTIFKLAQYSILNAENSETALGVIEKNRIDLILCSLNLPSIDGLTLKTIMEADHRLGSIPFIFLGKQESSGKRRSAMNIGADDVFIEPFENSDLLKAIATRIRKKNIHDQQHKNENASHLIDAFKNKRIVNFNANSFIFRKHEIANYLYYLEKGMVKCIQLNSDGKELIVEIIEPNQLFGIEALLGNREYFYSALTLEDCKIKRLKLSDFNKLLENNPENYKWACSLLTQKIENAENRLLDFAYESAKKRVALVLKELFLNSEIIELSRTEIANLAGTTLETTVRTISELKSSNIIASEKQNLHLIDQEGLKRVLDNY